MGNFSILLTVRIMFFIVLLVFKAGIALARKEKNKIFLHCFFWGVNILCRKEKTRKGVSLRGVQQRSNPFFNRHPSSRFNGLIRGLQIG
ncbi:MAG: hypothetical protein MJ210_04435, partial [Alphaproteobacteria bacterium]|nr:hypothetical protein [Alphaproteobacteria bacterium]